MVQELASASMASLDCPDDAHAFLPDGESNTLLGDGKSRQLGYAPPFRLRRFCLLGLATALLTGLVLTATFVLTRPRCHREGIHASLGSATGLAEVDNGRADAIIQVLKAKPEGELKGLMARVAGNASKPAPQRQMIHKVVESAAQMMLKQFPLSKIKARGKSLNDQRLAICSFNVIWAVQSLAQAATKIQAAARTCPKVAGALRNVCALNSMLVFSEFSHMGFAVALAASSCAKTIDIKAICAGISVALAAGLSELAAGGFMAWMTCRPGATGTGKDFTPIPGATPADLLGAPLHGGRRLFLGGGTANFAAQCALDSTEVAWAFASTALAITAAVENNCPPQGVGLLKNLTTSACAIDISVAIFYLSRVSMFVSAAVVHCTNTWNIPAICATGLSSFIAAAAGVSVVGNGFYLTCDKGLSILDKIGKLPGGNAALNQLLAGTEIEGARRLGASDPAGAAAEEDRRLRKLLEGFGYNVSEPTHVPRFDSTASALDAMQTLDEFHTTRMGIDEASLKRAFRSPEDLWQRLGYDVSNPKSVPAAPVPDSGSARIVELVEPVLGLEDRERVATAALPVVQKSEWHLWGDRCV